ncbi:hypothetical protein JR316_0004429 [Psilocybe cubensis]|uniref:Uncharacterized protein n=2 Tax=Psilocybe cubensis TaxID=181762 RepID=A0ACB8H382_PSICU|nr:hypothetical protein JR316_0004429 [Psilocybe cubensis]KAH9482331.1 hypothetical protein JR316_0004429 [Psilocybe cubensis]
MVSNSWPFPNKGVTLYTKQGEIPMVTKNTRLVNMFTKPRPVRSTSPSSVDADYGESDEDEVETMEEYAENLLEEEEVYHWLVASDPQPWPSPEIKAPTEAPFAIWGVPAPLIFQLFQFLMIYFGFLPKRQEHSMPIPQPMPPRRPLHPLHYYDPQERAKLQRWDNTRPPPEEDDMTLVVFPHPGRNEILERIRMTRDWSSGMLDTHQPSTLRVYRVREEDRVAFYWSVSAAHLLFIWIRKPIHDFDTIAVYRHGHRCWDFDDKEAWALVSGGRWIDSVRLRAVADRTTKWPLSRKGRLYFGIYRGINWILRRLGIAVQVNVPDLLNLQY